MAHRRKFMTTTNVTPEVIAEAKRRLTTENGTLYQQCGNLNVVAILAEALASPAWVPPVDPDLVLARSVLAEMHPTCAHAINSGGWDEAPPVRETLAGIKAADRRAGRAAERARGEA
jgi:hypothetical protein